MWKFVEGAIQSTTDRSSGLGLRLSWGLVWGPGPTPPVALTPLACSAGHPASPPGTDRQPLLPDPLWQAASLYLPWGRWASQCEKLIQTQVQISPPPLSGA